MCGPFKSPKDIMRLLEIIFSALAFIVVIFRGRMVSPWGVWCEFVWFFCIIVPLVLLVMEAMKWNILLAAILPNWDDLSCGLTLLCAVMITSATIIFGAIFLCLLFDSILCFIFSLIAAVIFWVDGVMQKMKCPSGYFATVRGILRKAEAFIACIILSAAFDFLIYRDWDIKPFWTICCIIIFFICLLVTAIIIILNLLKIIQAMLPFRLSMIEFVFDIVAVVVYVLAIILWLVFGYRLYRHSPHACQRCGYADVNTVSIGAIVNLILYIVDLVLAFKAR